MNSNQALRAIRAVLTTALVTGLAALTVGCNSKPNTALCGRYYRHTLTIQERDGQPGALAGLKTEGAKRAVLNHCLQLDRAQVECVLDAGSTTGATACERGDGYQSSPGDAQGRGTSSDASAQDYEDDLEAEAAGEFAGDSDPVESR
ncbi:MAG: hypothetical protein RIF32_05385 [Leptospirales bacterium]